MPKKNSGKAKLNKKIIWFIGNIKLNEDGPIKVKWIQKYIFY